MAHAHNVLADLQRAAASGGLTVVTDYYGTLSPPDAQLAQAWPTSGAVGALQRLGLTPGVRVVVLSGRSRREIDRLLHHENHTHPYPFSDSGLAYHNPESGVTSRVHVIGADGMDPDLVPSTALPTADPAVGGGTAESSKGDGITYLAKEFGDPIVFIGDDASCVSGFAALRDGDVGVVVGDATLEALENLRLLDRGNLIFVRDPRDVVQLLRRISAPAEGVSAAEISIASYRLPVSVGADGALTPSMGGVATALASMTPPPSHWVGELSGHSGTLHSGDTEFHPLTLSAQEHAGFYAHFSNGLLWPTYHGLTEFVPGHDDSEFWRGVAGDDFEQYRVVNQRYADKLAEQAGAGAIAWVHDYQLQLVPGMLRELRPDLTLGYFGHTPFPSYREFATIPHREELLASLLTNDVIGLQTPRDVVNFTDTVRQALHHAAVEHRQLLVNGERVGMYGGTIYVGERPVTVHDYPISIDYNYYDELGRADATRKRTQKLNEDLGGRKVVGSAERLDYTKGIAESLDAVELLLEEGKFDPREHVRYMSFAGHRGGVTAAQEYAGQIANRINALNKKYGQTDPGTGKRWEPIFDFWGNVPPDDVPAVFRISDVMSITPLKDGMNLMAKEFVASRVDELGVLLLGEGAGAAVELGGPDGAVIVDPRNVRQLADATHRALHMPETEQRRRMRHLRRQVRTHPVSAWTDAIGTDLLEAQAANAVRHAAASPTSMPTNTVPQTTVPSQSPTTPAPGRTQPAAATRTPVSLTREQPKRRR